MAWSCGVCGWDIPIGIGYIWRDCPILMWRWCSISGRWVHVLEIWQMACHPICAFAASAAGWCAYAIVVVMTMFAVVFVPFCQSLLCMHTLYGVHHILHSSIEYHSWCLCNISCMCLYYGAGFLELVWFKTMLLFDYCIVSLLHGSEGQCGWCYPWRLYDSLELFWCCSCARVDPHSASYTSSSANSHSCWHPVGPLVGAWLFRLWRKPRTW